ncbi:transcriptional regulator [Photobacterium swingsii]|uniref:Crp/Fnr family transcriptional regulator n=1 Tax=Photobacterium swingsii TaxID=680026 RepID=A0A0J8XWP2_9GAMM|nr:Crp/Fnr family transcriptional regulator [Photobacterium swingsii]KMV29784.1 transcriptional regulator [Photobacterium swingsii]PSW22822.1 Crp/Fnr family transcriptional regulator [Photobacterium swingsii]
MPNSILSLLDDEEKKQLFATSQSVHYSTGDSLFNKDDTAQSMYLVVKGKVSLFRLMPNGDEKLFKVFLAGELIAEMAMFMTPRVYPMSARVDQETQLLAFHYTDVLSVFTKSPGISTKVMGYMSNRIHHLMDTVNILTQVNANQRLVMRLAEIYRLQLKQEGKVFLPVTKKLLATQLGMTPETLSRAIKKLKGDGFIVESGNQITLIDIPALCDFVGLTPDIFATNQG